MIGAEILLGVILGLPPFVYDKCPDFAICACYSYSYVEGERKCTKWKIVGYKNIDTQEPKTKKKEK